MDIYRQKYTFAAHPMSSPVYFATILCAYPLLYRDTSIPQARFIGSLHDLPEIFRLVTVILSELPRT